MRQPGETIAVNAQLISTETSAHLWADRFDGERGKLGQLQVEFVEGLRKAGPTGGMKQHRSRKSGTIFDPGKSRLFAPTAWW